MIQLNFSARQEADGKHLWTTSELVTKVTRAGTATQSEFLLMTLALFSKKCAIYAARLG